MGMSASQARYIQLAARLSDLELEGQQINQQRTNLANLSSKISEQALRMDVPTAPSPTSYMKDVYTAGKGDTATEFELNETGDKLTGSVYSSQVKSLSVVAGAETVDVSNQYPPVDKNPDVSAYTVTVTRPKLVDKTGYQLGDIKIDPAQYDTLAPGNAPEVGTAKDPNDKTKGTYTQEEVNKLKPKYQGSYTSFKYKDVGTKVENISVKNGTAPDTEYKNIGLDGAQTKTIEYSYINPRTRQYVEKASASDVQSMTEGYSDDQINSMVVKYYIDENGTKLSRNNFDLATGKLNEGVTLHTLSEQEKIDGGQAYEVPNEVKGSELYQKNPKGVDELIQRITNFALTENGGSYTKLDLSDWRIVDKGSDGIEAVKKSDGKATKYTDEGDDANKKEGYTTISGDIGYDKSGTPTITYTDPTTGKTVTKTLLKSQKLDDTEYTRAMNNYTNEKAEYDYQQEVFNQKTKELQNQDKQLQLKLERLDTERNALNTEIDAVKKVIQDNIDKSFKTFSG